jgi:hypothetical protein
MLQCVSVKSIRYGIHFAALIVAVLVFWLAKDVNPFGVFRSVALNYLAHNVLMGALYSSAIVVSLTDRTAISTLSAFGFIVLTILWSTLTPMIGWWGSVWLPGAPSFTRQLLFVLITGSAIGSAGLWLLVRSFWMKSLRRMDLSRTVTLCVAITLLVLLVSYVGGEAIMRSQFWVGVFGMLFSAWWLAFSISLYWSDTSKTPASR